jgi:glutathione S-transferase
LYANSTIADLSFVTWDILVPFIFGAEFEGLELKKNWPHYWAWHQRILKIPSVEKALKAREDAMELEKKGLLVKE